MLILSIICVNSIPIQKYFNFNVMPNYYVIKYNEIKSKFSISKLKFSLLELHPRRPVEAPK